ncbi:hypothetical protein NL676_005726 [Syzygium grande]|nr:hypothetical protein NL676_005726 [Syzygium grande]
MVKYSVNCLDWKSSRFQDPTAVRSSNFASAESKSRSSSPLTSLADKLGFYAANVRPAGLLSCSDHRFHVRI